MMFFANFNDKDARLDRHIVHLTDSKEVTEFLTKHVDDLESSVYYIECFASSPGDYAKINPSGHQDCCYLYMNPKMNANSSLARQARVMSSSYEKAIEALELLT